MLSAGQHNPTGRFDGLASLYAANRPSYPAAAIAMIVDSMPDRDRPITEVGSGTGILTRQLAAAGTHVIGIEPNESMRAEAGPAGAGIEYRAGQAESTGMEAGSASAIVAGQTFHWCEPVASLREFHRILMPGGWVNLIWNVNDAGDPLASAFWAVLTQASTERQIVSKPHYTAGQALLESSLFVNGERHEFANAQQLDREGFVGRAFSASFAPKECGASQALADGLRRLFDEHASGGTVSLKYITMMYRACRLT